MDERAEKLFGGSRKLPRTEAPGVNVRKAFHKGGQDALKDVFELRRPLLSGIF